MTDSPGYADYRWLVAGLVWAAIAAALIVTSIHATAGGGTPFGALFAGRAD